jgi:hypothetical protein
LWSDLQPRPGVYDFAVLDREMDRAVANGKLFSLGIKAGNDGTPDWIFATDRDDTPRPGGGGGVTRLHLSDYASDGEGSGCGVAMDLGSPTDPAYRELYFEMWRRVAEHIRTRSDWYRSLAYVKISGANLFSHENRLPRRCEAGCAICNPRVFAEHGYTESGLYAFFGEQEALLVELFPGKSLAYALIQDAFPQVNDLGEYDAAAATERLPGPFEQTQRVLDQGQLVWGELFVVQHNGLHPASVGCPNEGLHPAAPPYEQGSGCPNKWVLEEGFQGQVTGFQTSHLDAPSQLDATFANLVDNSDGVFLEVYESRFWEAAHASDTVLDPNGSGRTLAEWRDVLDARRRDRATYPTFPEDPFPAVHRFTFAADAGAQTLTYVNPVRCGRPGASFGVISIVR